MAKTSAKSSSKSVAVVASTPAASAASAPKHTVLICLCGMSPAVVTETVWALAHEPEPTIPHEVLVITTGAARKVLCEALFGQKSGWQGLRQALEKKLGKPALQGRLRFGDTGEHIRVITSAGDTPCELADIVGKTDCDAAAEYIMTSVRAHTEEPGTRVILSIAGGRKSMGALGLSVMTLIGRVHDRVTHVLVDEPWERQRDFLYPGCPVVDAAGKKLPTTKAQLTLADIPFVPMRFFFEKQVRGASRKFSTLMAEARGEVARQVEHRVSVVLGSLNPTLEISGQRVEASLPELACFAYLLQRQFEGREIERDATYKEQEKDFNHWAVKRLIPAQPQVWTDVIGSNFKFEDRATKCLSSLKDKISPILSESVALSLMPQRKRKSIQVRSENIDISY